MNDYMNDDITLNDVLNILESVNLISSKTSNNNNSIDVCDIKSFNIEDKKYVYIMGLTCEFLPLSNMLPNLLNQDDIDKNCLIKQLDDISNYSYHSFSKLLKIENITITYPKLSSDLKLTTKSIYLDNLNLKKMVDDKIYDKSELLQNYSILLSEEKMKKEDNDLLAKINISNNHNLKYELNTSLLDNDLYISPSCIENYFKCPFSYFCLYELKLKVKEKYIFDNKEVGTFVHYILENVIKNELDNINLDNLWDLILKYGNTYLEDNGKIVNNTTKYVLKVLEQSTYLIIKNIVSEMDVTKFRPSYFEFKIDDTSSVKPLVINVNNKKIKIGGIIDRVDTYQDDNNYYYRIIDYKTGNKNFKLKDVLLGLNLQMLIYLLAIKESNISNLNIVPSALLYYPALVKEKTYSRLDDDSINKRIKMIGIVNKDNIDILEKDAGTYINISSYNKIDEDKIYSILELNNLFSFVKDKIRKMAINLDNGNINVDPIGGQEDSCKYCNFESVCKFDKKYDRKRKIRNYKNKEVFKMLERIGDDNNA